VRGRRQPVLDYARPAAPGRSRFVEEAGDGYVVLRLPEPPLWMEVSRLAGILLVLAMILLVMAAIPFLWGNRARSISTGVVALLVLGGVGVAVATNAWEQAGIMYARHRLPPGKEHVVRIASPVSAVTAPGTLVITGVSLEVEDSLLPLGRRAFVSATTATGGTVPLLCGHPPELLRELVQELRAILFSGRAPRVRAKPG
jgi:hypothetical protein